MADISDVQAKLAEVIAAALYPAGTSVVGPDVSVFPGWPLPAQLEKDIAAGRVQVSIWAKGLGQNETRYREEWQELLAPVQTLTLTQLDLHTAEVGGTVTTPQVVVLNGQAYAVQPSDTLDSIAAGVAALVPGATASGAVITVPAGVTQVCISATGTVAKEVRRQTDTLQVSVWAPTPDLRSAVAKVIDQATADLRFLEMPDHTSARLIYVNTQSFDRSEASLIYRRDLNFKTEYATVVTAVATQIATPVVHANAVFKIS